MESTQLDLQLFSKGMILELINAFISIVQNLQGIEDVKKVIRKLAIKSDGERGFSAQKVMHHIMSLK